MQVSKNFYLWEFVSSGIYRRWGNNSIWFLDKRIITASQFIRTRFDYPVTICNWHDAEPGDKIYQYSGYRSPSCKVGANLSQHKFGRAPDLKMLGKPNNGADELRDDIKKNFHLYKSMGLTTIESEDYAPNWCHLDCRWTGMKELFIVKP